MQSALDDVASTSGGPYLVVPVAPRIILIKHLTQLERRKLNLKATLESSISHFSFKRLVPGTFNLGFIGSTCTALPSSARPTSTTTVSALFDTIELGRGAPVYQGQHSLFRLASLDTSLMHVIRTTDDFL